MAVLVLVLYIQVKIVSIYSVILIFPDQTITIITCGKMNGCFGTAALYTTEDNVNLQLYTLLFPDQTIMAQSGSGAEGEIDVTSLCTGQDVNFDDDTLKGKDSYNC